MLFALKPMLVTLSIAFNVAFLAMWGFHLYGTRVTAERQVPSAGQACAIWSPLHQRLGITTQQWAVIEPPFTRFQQASQHECREIQRLQSVLIEQLAASTVNHHVLDETQQALLAHQQTQQRLIIKQLVAEKRVLTPSQQRELFQLIRQQTRCLTPSTLLGDSPHVK